MATATAPVSRNQEAILLRAEAQALSKEVSQLREKLAQAQGRLGALQDKRQKLAESSARGEQPKPGVIAALRADIEDAEFPVNGLQDAVNEKQARLNEVRATLDALEQGLAIEVRQAARQVRFDEIAKQGREVAARISETLRTLVEEDLVSLDAVLDEVLNVYIGGPFSESISSEAKMGRALTRELVGTFFDGSQLAIERKLLRTGWAVRGDLQFRIQNLKPR